MEGETKKGEQQIVEQILENLSATDFRIFQSKKSGALWSLNFTDDWRTSDTKKLGKFEWLNVFPLNFD